jgi:uncharacterized protein (TIGR02217 family)
MAERASQIVVEAAVEPDTKARATQVIVEAQVEPSAPAQATQTVVEAQIAPNAIVRATQIVVSAPVAGDWQPGGPPPPGSNPSTVRATQIIVSVLLWNWTPPMPATYPTLLGLTYSVIKRPIWSTGVSQHASGREMRIGHFSEPLYEFELIYEFLMDQPPQAPTSYDLKNLLGFYNLVHGGFTPFLFKDPDDYTVTAQALGTTDGVLTNWDLVRTYGYGTNVSTDHIGYVDLTATFHAYLNTVLVDPADYDVSQTVPGTQQIRFHTPPTTGQALTVTMTYFYYCRFLDDQMDFEKFLDRIWQLKRVVLRSLRG